ncbi:hypothetical protein LOD99_6249 [Oopsacas minuta]|uniref:Uncharacterized protein n=1 Tax=Oopsacas minuta TaxID=111878 RepID=A0AAV7JMI3_9METZ|nr:hypothetical protein LOD99_6243 [Oopsacas minuta]KAI6650034.1 hypothetical protein LOD99_6249 [Oopsacas minuta]
MSLRLNPVPTVSEILAARGGQRFRRVRNVQNPRPRLVFQHATDIEKIEDQFDSDCSERDGDVAEDSDDWSSEDEESDIESEMELLDEGCHLSLDIVKYLEEPVYALPSSKRRRID